MAEVSLSVGGRRYVIGCADGDVGRVRALAEEIAQAVDGLGEQADGARGILMAALVMIDRERSRTEEAMRRADGQLKEARKAAARVGDLAGRLEELASSFRERPRDSGAAVEPHAGGALAASGPEV